MCSNYVPVRRENALILGRGPIDFPYQEHCFPGREAPFLSNFDPGVWLPGVFGLLPGWADPALARRTYNARSETVAEKRSFRNAWRNRQLAIVPVEAFFEPNYSLGRPVRWSIARADGLPFGLAALWERRRTESDMMEWSFTLLTINADSHPLMRQFHKPSAEKRSVVPLAPTDWDAWLEASTEAEIRAFLRPFDPLAMRADPAPVP